MHQINALSGSTQAPRWSELNIAPPHGHSSPTANAGRCADRHAVGSVEAPFGAVSGAASGPLGRYDNNLDASCQNKPIRARLHRFRREIQRNSLSGKRQGRCGLDPLGKFACVSTSNEHGSASISGVETCSSVWSCPICRNKIVTHRADELKRIEQIWRKGSGATGTIHMITFTAPHTRTQRPADFYGDNESRSGLSGAMTMLRQSKTWRRMKRATGHIADVRAVETTWGKASGYHIHIHMVLYFTAPVDLAIWRDELIDE